MSDGKLGPAGQQQLGDARTVVPGRVVSYHNVMTGGLKVSFDKAAGGEIVLGLEVRLTGEIYKITGANGPLVVHGAVLRIHDSTNIRVDNGLLTSLLLDRTVDGKSIVAVETQGMTTRDDGKVGLVVRA